MRSILRLLNQLVNLGAITCDEATHALSARLDEPLSMGRRCRLAIHLMICKWCRRYARQVELLRAAMRRLAESPTSGAATVLPADARESIKEALRRRSA